MSPRRLRPRIVLLGKPGAGKTTQAIRLSRHYVVPHICIDDVIRSAIRGSSKRGKWLGTDFDDSDPVPPDVVVTLIRDCLLKEGAAGAGFVLDGFPRTRTEADGMTGIDDPAVVLWLVIGSAEVTERLTARRVCSGCGAVYSATNQGSRVPGICDLCDGEVVHDKDDNEAAIRQRMEQYERQAIPVLRWFEARTRVSVMSGAGDPDSVTDRLVQAIDHR